MLARNKLEAQMKLHGDTQATLGEAIGITGPTLSVKMNPNKTNEFTLSELDAIHKRYNLSGEEFFDIFFADEVSQLDTTSAESR